MHKPIFILVTAENSEEARSQADSFIDEELIDGFFDWKQGLKESQRWPDYEEFDTPKDASTKESMQFIVDRLGGEGNVVVFSAPQHEGIRNRTLGVYSVADMYPGINIVARHDISWAVGDPTPLDAMQNILQAHPNKGDIDALWAPYDTAAAQISNASEQAGRADEMFVTGVDGDDMAFVDYINVGKNFVATAAQTPYWMAKTTVVMAYKYLDGEKIPRHITAPYVLATKEKNVQPGYDMNM